MSIVKELAKLAAEKIIHTLETPRDVRKLKKLERRTSREPWMMRYFGMVPMSFSVWWTNRRDRNRTDADKNTPGA